MYRVTCAALLALAACVSAPVATGYRDPAVAISSTTAFDPARFQGDWQVVAALGPDAGCGRLEEAWTIEAGAFTIRGTECGPGGRTGFLTRARLVGPGRLLRDGRAGAEPLWILWMDADDRVAAIGTPDGRFGRILARPGQARADLLGAAREILDFNGYDISSLQFLH